jgi:hypothetical protein
MHRVRLILPLAIAAAAAVAPSAHAATYAATLTGSVQMDSRESFEAEPPTACQGTIRHEERGRISTLLIPSSAPAQLLRTIGSGSRPLLPIFVRFRTPSGTFDFKNTGAFTPKPNGSPGAEEECRQSTPPTAHGECQFRPEVRRPTGFRLALTEGPGGRVKVTNSQSNNSPASAACKAEIFGLWMAPGVTTSLRWNRVRGLRVGGSVSAAGVARETHSAQDPARTTTTVVRYALRIRRAS